MLVRTTNEWQSPSGSFYTVLHGKGNSDHPTEKLDPMAIAPL
ncbi:hypothetical protein [Coleofasciculus sp. FACHB-1120]|nr:hypothetical protein [Coleofasciculus sp. FACHB-1120]